MALISERNLLLAPLKRDNSKIFNELSFGFFRAGTLSNKIKIIEI